jgi:hypothetical protein
MASKMKTTLENLGNQTDKDSQRKASGQKTADATVTSLDVLAENITEGYLNIVAAKVELNLTKGFQDGTLQSKIEDRLFPRLSGFSDSFENNLLQIEGEIDSVDKAFLLPSTVEVVNQDNSYFPTQSDYN